MNLKKGIVINSLFSEDLNRIFINSGTSHYSKVQIESVKFAEFNFLPLFRENAYVPKHDWRSLDSKENKSLLGKKYCYNTITIGEINHEIRDYFEKLQITELTNRESVIEKMKSNPKIVQSITESIQKFLLPISQNQPFNFHCIAANLPNLELVACDISKLHAGFTIPERKYEGLHNDGTKSMKIHSMYKKGNRITVNIGKQSRIFYFINLTLSQAFNMLKSETKFIHEDINIQNIGTLFFKTFPNYPVIKVIQKPYEFYIAPTDNCFHDGSTLGNSALDINMVYFGFFTC